MVDCPYCNAEVHVESENIRDEFRETCGVCDREFIVYLDWSLSSEPLPAKSSDPDIHRGRYHHPDCNYWKWDWRYSWAVSDCNCEEVAGPTEPDKDTSPAQEATQVFREKYREALTEQDNGAIASRIAQGQQERKPR